LELLPSPAAALSAIDAVGADRVISLRRKKWSLSDDSVEKVGP